MIGQNNFVSSFTVNIPSPCNIFTRNSPQLLYCTWKDWNSFVLHLISLKMPKMKTVGFANSVDPDEAAHELPHLGLHCFVLQSLNFSMTELG